MSELSYKDATHELLCRHCVGKNCRDYTMPCNILKSMPDGRLKVQVFGDRYWIRGLDKVSVRYVDRDRVREVSRTRN